MAPFHIGCVLLVQCNYPLRKSTLNLDRGAVELSIMLTSMHLKTYKTINMTTFLELVHELNEKKRDSRRVFPARFRRFRCFLPFFKFSSAHTGVVAGAIFFPSFIPSYVVSCILGAFNASGYDVSDTLSNRNNEI